MFRPSRRAETIGISPMMPRAVEDVELAGGRVNASGVWVPAKQSCPERPLEPMPPVEWAASRLLRPYNASLDRAGRSEHVERSHWHVKRACAACAASRAECLTCVSKRCIFKSRACSACQPPPSRPTAPTSALLPSVSCADGAERLRASAVRLFIGVHSAAHLGRPRRDGIRDTWLRWDDVGVTAVVCFLLGRRNLADEQLAAVEAERARHRDIAMLDVADECGITLPKMYAWWRLAMAMLPQSAAVHVAKVDDDSFVHVPNLLAELDMMSCAPSLVYGAIAHVGYNPVTFRMCGFDWGSNPHRLWRRYNCEARGMHKPFPFATGAIQVRSSRILLMS